MEYTQGAYNKSEHDHTTWTDQQLMDEAIRLGNMLRGEQYTGERREGLSKQMAKVAAEQYFRYQEK